MDQEADAAGEGAGHRDFGGVQQRDDVPAVAGRAGGKGGVEVAGHGEKGAHDVVGVEPVGLDQRAQQLVGRLEDLLGVVGFDGGGAADAVQPEGMGSVMAT